MRILIWTDAFWPEIGGLEVFSMRICTGLKARGHDCLVVTNRPEGAAVPHDTYEDVPVRRYAFHETLNRVALREYRQEMEDCARAMAAFEADVIHFNACNKNLLSFAVTQRRQPRPVLMTLHDRNIHPSRGLLAREVFAYADVVTGVSEFLRRDVLSHFPEAAEKLFTVMNALPTPELAPESPPAELRLLALGRLVRDKGFDLAIAGFGRLAAEFPAATLTIAGDGPERMRLQDEAARLGLSARIEFTGWCAPEEIPALISRHAMVIMPSRWEEPFGLVALQAAQMGRPICAARSGGIPEIVVEGETGFLFEKEDAAGLARALGRLLADGKLREEMGRRALARARQVFDFPRFLDRYEELFALAIERRRTATTAGRPARVAAGSSGE